MEKEIRHGGSKAFFAKRQDRYDPVKRKYSWKFKLVAAPWDAFRFISDALQGDDYYDQSDRKRDAHNKKGDAYWANRMDIAFGHYVFNKEWWSGDLAKYAADFFDKKRGKILPQVLTMCSRSRCLNCNEMFVADTWQVKFCCNNCLDAHKAKNPKSRAK